MAMGLTRNQLDAARVIHEFQCELGRAPTFEELRHELDRRGRGAAHHLVARLEERGWARRGPAAEGGQLELLHVPPMPEECAVDVTDAGLAAIAARAVSS